ncbi:MAG TPA: hypothetical protein VMY37_37615 [Thermoguttaceae bacterium]|nr:hypothetical protein [Thermoguttaceae bacterium]
MGYSRTQHGRFHYGLYVAAAAALAATWGSRHQPLLMCLVLGVAGLIFLFTQSFHYLTVRDEGDALAIRFGPLPLLRKRVPYSQITAVEPGRTSLIDGWGVHWIPGRGWTYNIWGFDCVKICMGKRVIRVGSDDMENLVAFLSDRIQQFDR